ncbi:MAG TPA: nickel pincer cofactor biosynthesis protein LarC, partial [Thermoplasmata archaeon]|nr:nickel pincer cofactor biosynthesis protein LarC [Thermoplasmata archaeon]
RKVKKRGISGTKLDVVVKEKEVKRTIGDILRLLNKSALDLDVKNKASQVFQSLAEAEAKVHGLAPEEVHLHEAGGMDTIIDVVGTILALKNLEIKELYSSKVHLGTGFVECEHGVLPVPAPVTLELLKDVPVYSKGVEFELTTPTGAALLKTLSKGFGPIPDMMVEKIGYGAGERDLEIPNMLRVYIGEITEREQVLESDEVFLLETNIDDMNPEFFEYVVEKLLSEGSLDVYITPIFMKKNRPATLLSVLCQKSQFETALTTIFKETTTLGIRVQKVDRLKLKRKTVSVSTKFGKVKVKIGIFKGKVFQIAPEYQDCKKLAQECGVPLKEIYHEAKTRASEIVEKEGQFE